MVSPFSQAATELREAAAEIGRRAAQFEKISAEFSQPINGEISIPEAFARLKELIPGRSWEIKIILSAGYGEQNKLGAKFEIWDGNNFHKGRTLAEVLNVVIAKHTPEEVSDGEAVAALLDAGTTPAESPW